MERRTNPRLKLALSCSLRRASGNKKKIIGTTANISRTGALIRCLGVNGNDRPREGDLLIIDVALPENSSTTPRCFHGRASVVRATVSDAGELFLAVRFDKLRFAACHGKCGIGHDWARPVETMVM